MYSENRSGIYLAAGNCRGHTEIKPEELEFTVSPSMYFGALLEKLLPKSIGCLQRSVCVRWLFEFGGYRVTALRILSRIKHCNGLRFSLLFCRSDYSTTRLESCSNVTHMLT